MKKILFLFLPFILIACGKKTITREPAWLVYKYKNSNYINKAYVYLTSEKTIRGYPGKQENDTTKLHFYNGNFIQEDGSAFYVDGEFSHVVSDFTNGLNTGILDVNKEDYYTIDFNNSYSYLIDNQPFTSFFYIISDGNKMEEQMENKIDSVLQIDPDMLVDLGFVKLL